MATEFPDRMPVPLVELATASINQSIKIPPIPPIPTRSPRPEASWGILVHLDKFHS